MTYRQVENYFKKNFSFLKKWPAGINQELMDTAGNLWRIFWRGKPTRKKNSQVSFILVVARRWERKLSVPLSTGGLTGFNESAHLQPPSRTPPQFSIYERIKSPPPHWEEQHESITWRPCSGIELWIELFPTEFNYFLTWSISSEMLVDFSWKRERDTNFVTISWSAVSGHSAEMATRHNPPLNIHLNRKPVEWKGQNK